uniref:Protein FAR-RED ELONGATED HYPOCOTYL 3-like n=1 Tax=Cicer arietinum TaxID=3827 RepID=A0A1S2YNJ4_CICAR|nr:protein FAR-RED ELONGATED HYPOCOTYL 3-like [Cicer arietinum]
MCDDVEPNFDAMNDGVEPVMIDLIDVFTTGMMFDTRDELLKWARNVGRENGIVVVIFRSETATARQRTKTKLILGCERSGKYRPWKNPNLTRSTWTRKCDCPFRLRGTRSSVGDGWYLHVICGLHNHELAKKLTGHSFLGRLSQDEKNVLGDMTKNFVKPKNILMTLRDHNVESLTTIKQVYNARQAYRTSLRGNRTEMQHLLTLMKRDKYVYQYKKVDGSDELRDIFWTHPDAITLVNNFHIILIMDSTYKTCRYRMPLLEIIGVTSTEMTFCVGFAYLQSERVDNFTWALQMVKEQITSGEVEVIVTDRDLALMNAVENVFPKAVNLLCLFHICKNVKVKCKMIVFPKKKQVQIMEAWEALLQFVLLDADVAKYH